MTKITFEFDDDTDSDDLKMFQSSRDMHSALYNIYNLARDELEGDEGDISVHIETILEEIVEKASKFV